MGGERRGWCDICIIRVYEGHLTGNIRGWIVAAL